MHGLLVGAPRPTPLDLMCDEVHPCLSEFDPLAILRKASDARAADVAAGVADTRGVLAASAGRVVPSGAVPATGGATTRGVGATAARRVSSAAMRMCAAAGDQEPPTTLQERAAAHVTIALAAREAAEAATSSHAAAPEAAAASATRVLTLRAAASALETGLVEREGEARLLLLALVGGEHLLLLGPPGTAKSALCRRVSDLANLSYFERTLTRFSTPEELFGPLSLAALERDEYRRATAGFAPDAQLLFIDEIFKSNSASLNTLLTLLNERLFDDGAQRSASSTG